MSFTVRYAGIFNCSVESRLLGNGQSKKKKHGQYFEVSAIQVPPVILTVTTSYVSLQKKKYA